MSEPKMECCGHYSWGECCDEMVPCADSADSTQTPKHVEATMTTAPAAITASANARAIATATGIVGLRPDEPGVPACELRDDGSSIWRLRRGLTVEMEQREDGSVHWHLDRDDNPA